MTPVLLFLGLIVAFATARWSGVMTGAMVQVANMHYDVMQDAEKDGKKSYAAHAAGNFLIAFCCMMFFLAVFLLSALSMLVLIFFLVKGLLP